MKEILARLRFLNDVGLDYLTLDRAAGTLSGGEAQRIRLATQIGSGLVGVLYILDELLSACISATTANFWQLCSTCATWATRCWWLNTMKKPCMPQIRLLISAPVQVNTAAMWLHRARQKKLNWWKLRYRAVFKRPQVYTRAEKTP